MKNPTWTDAELLTYDFDVLGRPDADPRLAREVPRHPGLAKVLQSYDIAPPDVPGRRALQPYVWCALCQEATHWKGWICESVDGAAFLLGKDCAKRHCGVDFQKTVNSFLANQDRAERLRQCVAVRPLLAELQQATTEICAVSAGYGVKAFRASLNANLTILSQRLINAARANPPVLLEEKRVRDRAAEQARTARSRSGDEGGAIYRFDYTPLGRLQGVELFAGPDIKMRADTLSQSVARGRAVIDRSDYGHLKTDELKSALGCLQTARALAAELALTSAHLSQGVSAANVALICRWARLELREDYHPDGHAIVFEGWPRPSRVELPTIRPFAEPPIFAAVEAAIRSA